jgi:hypothetical protein
MARRRKGVVVFVDEPGEGRGNGFDPDRLGDIVGRIEVLQAEIDMINLEARERIQPLRADIAAVKREAIDADIDRGALACVLRKRRLEMKAQQVADSLDLAERANFAEMILCLERLAKEVGPLGKAALDHARAAS